MFSDGQWRKLYNSHFIDKLYNYWLNSLLLPNIETLNKIASRGDWQETKTITELFPVICKYDRDSSYFRYPITKNSLLDNEKYTIQKFKAKSLDGIVEEIKEQKPTDNKGTVTMLLFDDADNIIEAFKHTKTILSDVRDALKEVAFYFKCIHTMTRVTLCGGM